VIRYRGQGHLTDSDPGGEAAAFDAPDAPDNLPPNNQLVIYELPTAWTLTRSLNAPERAAATFLDVAALVDERIGGPNFAELSLLDAGKAYLADLGVNALELLPLADSFFKREWSYDTSHYLAPDYELGYPEGNLSPTPNKALPRLDAVDFYLTVRRQTRTTPTRRPRAAPTAPAASALALAARCGGTPSQ
jgi:hypothetical protein